VDHLHPPIQPTGTGHVGDLRLIGPSPTRPLLLMMMLADVLFHLSNQPHCISAKRHRSYFIHLPLVATDRDVGEGQGKLEAWAAVFIAHHQTLTGKEVRRRTLALTGSG